MITNICTEGDFCGYTSILENINYRENAEVLDDARLMIIPAAEFLTLVTSDVRVAKQFMHLITRNVLEMEEDLLNLAYNSIRKKVAYGIVQQIDAHHGLGKVPIVLDLSRKEMAQSIGVATESLVRTLADFKGEKLIDILEGKIIILNESNLRKLPS